MYASDAQIIQSLATPGMPEELKAYYIDVIKAKQGLMRSLLRAFGREDINSLIPVPSVIKENRNAQINGIGAGQNNSRNVSGQGGNAQTLPIGPSNGQNSTLPQ
jgi:hypothetical protein